MKRVGILSDTHGHLSLTALGCLVECDQIIHAGDIGDPGILRELEQYAPVTAVLGNNDYPDYGPKVGRFACVEVEAVSFLVGHYPRDVRLKPSSGLSGFSAWAPGDPIPQVCVHGHVHYPVLLAGEEAAPAKLVVCPGSVSYPRMGSAASVAIVEVEDGIILRAWVQSLSGEVILRA